MGRRRVPWARTLAAAASIATTAWACTLVTDTRGLMSNAPAGDASVAETSADAAIDAATDAFVFTPETLCPNRGGDMVNVGAFCIDILEVGMGRYDEFLEAGAPPEQPPSCAFNTDFARGDNFGNFDPGTPVTDVDWCDAFAFCKWAGKRLCGAPQGGATKFEDFAAASASQWSFACSSNGANAWPYGNEFDAGTCRGKGYPDFSDYVQPSRVATECRAPNAPFRSLYDMSGNAAEWEDSCEGRTGRTDRCRVRGGGRQDDATALRCDADATRDRSERSFGVTFRCCWP